MKTKILMHSLFEEIYHQIIREESDVEVFQLLKTVVDNYTLFEPTWHALGFIHCKLGEFSKGTLRLHIWPSNENHDFEQKEKIHDHRFSLRSHVVVGTISNEIFNIIEGDKNNSEYQSYEVEYLDVGSRLIPTGSYCNIELEKSYITRDNDSYSVSSEELHRSTSLASSFSLTLVATFNHINKPPIMLGKACRSNFVSRDIVLYDKKKWVSYLNSALCLIE
ncbi:hypothetical protein AB4356_13715 [Vibrio lentus]